MADHPSGAPASTDLVIFISYRRDDTRSYAGRVSDHLRKYFGKDRVFFDVDTLAPGQDWVASIEGAVDRSDVLLALIDDRWLKPSDETGRRRIDESSDWVRLEIEAALHREKAVIPVLIEDARMPRREELPESLQPLRERQASHIAHASFRSDLGQLVKSLRKLENAKRERHGMRPRTGRRGSAASKSAEARPGPRRSETVGQDPQDSISDEAGKRLDQRGGHGSGPGEPDVAPASGANVEHPYGSPNVPPGAQTGTPGPQTPPAASAPITHQPFPMHDSQSYRHPNGWLSVYVSAGVLYATNMVTTVSEFFPLGFVPVGQWTPMFDTLGQPIPIAVLIWPTGQVFGAWL
jgi:hypothetical protein